MEKENWFMVEVQKMRSEGMLVDVTLCAEGREIPCHRLVLAANSEYFKVMFNGSHSESRKDKIEIGGVSAETLQLLVDFSYTSTIDVSENVNALFQAADMLQFPQVYKKCEECLWDLVSEDTCVETWALADRVSCTRLAEKAKSWAMKWFDMQYTTKEFLQLPFHLLKTYVSDEHLFAEEQQILEAIMLWARHDLTEREGHLKELLKCVCFSSIGKDYLENLMKEDEVFARVPGISYMMRSQTMRMVRRVILEKNMLVIGGVTEKTTTTLNNKVYRLRPNFECGNTNLLPKKLWGSRGMAACAFHDHVIVTGGDKSMSQAWRYKPRQNSWVRLPNLRTGRYDHGMAVLGGQLYMVGGAEDDMYDEDDDDEDEDDEDDDDDNDDDEWDDVDVDEKWVIPDVEVYDKKSNGWKLTKQLRVAVSNFAIAACRGKLYVFGGETDENYATNGIQCFDPKNKKWSLDLWLPEAVSCLSACTVGSKIYLVGGPLQQVMCFDPEEETAVSLAHRLVPWDRCSATVCWGEIYITGGRAYDRTRPWYNSETLAYVQCYNVDSDNMVLCNDLPERLYGHCTVTIKK